jgi:hypothetical protein
VKIAIMKAKKTIWIPIATGVVSAALNILVSEAHFGIPIGDNAFIGIVEISNTLSASLGGPIALIITVVVTNIGHFILNLELYADIQFIFLTIADALIHIFALLVVATSYYRFLYPRFNKTGLFLVGWWLTLSVYYYLALLPLQTALINFSDPSFGVTYPSFARIFLPEFLATSMITTLIWFALPVHYRRSRWVTKKESEKAGAVQDI